MESRFCLLVVALASSACKHKEEGAEAPRLARLSSSTVDPKVVTLAAPERQPSRVSLAGVWSALPAPSAADGQRQLFARSARVWISAEPRGSAARIGYLRAGASVLAATASAGRDGCSDGWHAIQPRGFVCVGVGATFDDADPVVRATHDTPPDFSRRLPYLYGTVRKPGPVYARLPSSAELAATEPELESRMQAWLAAPGENGASYGQSLWLPKADAVPDPALAWSTHQSDELTAFDPAKSLPSLEEQPRGADLVLQQMKPRAGYSFLRTFLWQGRRYGLAADLTLAPTDRFRPIQGSSFHGVEIGKDVSFPFAFVRSEDARLWIFERSKNALTDAGPAAYRSVVRLSGKQQFFRGRLHFETTDGKWLSDATASRLDPPKRMPAWGKNGERWLDVNVTKQTLVAYDGVRPVYATLISSGEAGLDDPEHSTATKRGIFRIHTKHVTTTMSSDEVGEEFELRDVPYVQYFEQGYALHAAYWHDRFGTPKSHGCINLAPEDARRLFFFTDPPLPEGWHGVLLPLRGSVVFVHP